MLTKLFHLPAAGRAAARAKLASARDEAQAAWAFILSLMVVFMFFAVAFDAGMWVFDHRTAQNQAEASALAAAIELPATDTAVATARAEEWLIRNGVDVASEGCSPDWITFEAVATPGNYDKVSVCLRRSSNIVFAALTQISDMQVSAAATARTGRVAVSNVVPWAIVAPDPTCEPGDICEYDANGDGNFTGPGECQATFDDCPWGLNPDNLYAFKVGGGGNTGIIEACGNGAGNYRNCVSGQASSGFYAEGETVNVGLQGGNLGNNTHTGLQTRLAAENAAGGWACDVPATPDTLAGFDPDGRALAYQRFDTNPPHEFCRERLVMVPIIASMPAQGGGNASLEVLGVATFGIASWNRHGSHSAYGTTTSACSTSNPSSDFECGMVWGYLMEGLRPPDFLLQRISDSNNPFAPLLIALVE